MLLGKIITHWICRRAIFFVFWIFQPLAYDLTLIQLWSQQVSLALWRTSFGQRLNLARPNLNPNLGHLSLLKARDAVDITVGGAIFSKIRSASTEKFWLESVQNYECPIFIWKRNQLCRQFAIYGSIDYRDSINSEGLNDTGSAVVRCFLPRVWFLLDHKFVSQCSSARRLDLDFVTLGCCCVSNVCFCGSECHLWANISAYEKHKFPLYSSAGE